MEEWIQWLGWIVLILFGILLGWIVYKIYKQRDGLGGGGTAEFENNILLRS